MLIKPYDNQAANVSTRVADQNHFYIHNQFTIMSAIKYNNLPASTAERNYKMKKSIIKNIGIVILVVIFTVCVSHAEQRKMSVVEMADGNLVTFPITTDDTTTKKVAKKNPVKNETDSPNDRYVIYEMGENGRIVTYRMTEEEMIAKDADLTKEDAGPTAQTRKPESTVETFELPESGNVITFPVTEDITNYDTAKRTDEM